MRGPTTAAQAKALLSNSVPRHPDLDACVSMIKRTPGCMLVIEACFMDRPRVATPGKIWLTAAALCSLVEHRLRGSKSQDPTNTAFRSGHPGRPGTSHPRRTCRAQRVSSLKTCACKITGDAVPRRPTKASLGVLAPALRIFEGGKTPTRRASTARAHALHRVLGMRTASLLCFSRMHGQP